MRYLNKINIMPLAITISIFLCLLVFSVPTFGITPIQAGADAAQSQGQPDSLFGTAGIFTTITNTMLFMVGALSVVMLIFGGLRYVISGGNATTITAAKNTILYAIVGLVVAILAYAAINFVLSTLIPGASVGGTNV